MTKIPSASASQPARSTNAEFVIEMPPLQQPNQTPTPAANPALSRLAPRPSRGRDNPERNTGSGSAADRNQHPGESPPLHAADASILHDEESTSEHFFDA
ncbi:hypothetical protein LYZ86_15210 [Xanthomonas hortorum pv. cynarae]|nr:hypothetical protein [Xanthomonas hortorum]MCE4350571.1 hypothetical protein [Xanthomonas hortorum pv. cynarae]